MCLSKIDEQYDHPSSVITDGWKEFIGTDSKPMFQNNNLNGKRDVPLDQWIKADTSLPITATDGKSYSSGFHVYEDEGQLRTIRDHIRRVFVRSVSVRGTEGSKSIAIAQEMYVPSDRNGWPPKPGEPTKKESMLDKAKGMLKPGNA